MQHSRTTAVISAVTALAPLGGGWRVGPSERKYARLSRKVKYDAAVRAKVGPEATEARLAKLK